MLWNKSTKSRILFWSLEILIIASLIFVLTKIKFIFGPLVTFFQTLFAPVLIAIFLYYILNPLVELLEKIKIKRILGILLVFLLLAGIIVFTVMEVIPSLVNQLIQLGHSIPKAIDVISHSLQGLSHEKWIKDVNIEQYLNKIDMSLGKMIQSVINKLTTGVGSIISSVTTTLMTMITAPVMLFYMLKDGHKLIPSIEKYLPNSMRDDISNLLHKMSKTLSSYISGQALECIFVAVMTFIGYKITGVPYAFLFSIIAGATNMIPYLGPYLGLAPAMITSLFIEPIKAVMCVIVVLVVQQIDSNIIYPNIIGKSLSIHPMTIIVILLVAGNISGVFGMFLGVPIYAIVKTIVIYLYDVYLLHKQSQDLVLLEEETKI